MEEKNFYTAFWANHGGDFHQPNPHTKENVTATSCNEIFTIVFKNRFKSSFQINQEMWDKFCQTHASSGIPIKTGPTQSRGLWDHPPLFY